MNVHVLSQGHPLLTVGAADALTYRSFQPGDRIVVCRHCKNLYLEENWEQVSSLVPRHGGRDNTLETIPEEIYRHLGRPPAVPPQTPTSPSHSRPQASAPPVEPRRRPPERPPAVTPNSVSPGSPRPRRLELLDPVAPVVRRTGPRPQVQLLESWRPSPSSPPIPTPPAPVTAVAPVARRTGPRPRVQFLESWRPSPSSLPIPTPLAPVTVSPSPPSPPVGKNPLQIPRAAWFVAGVAAAGLLALLLALVK